ncbi:MAG: carboxypeptidase-like regulatory domain-containing protein, partial [Cytophagales bacterium]
IEESDDAKLITSTPTISEKQASPSVGSKVSATYLSANRLSLISKDMFRDDICIVKGNITSSVVPVKDCELLLVDNEGKVLKKTFASEKGNFTFDKLPYGDYQILVDDYKGGIKINYSVEEDNSDIKDVNSLTKTVNNQDPATLLKKNKVGQITIRDARNVTGFFYESLGKEKKPIPNAEILLIDENLIASANAKTDQTGHFHLNNLNKGVYNVVTLKGFGLLNIGLDIKYRENATITNEY